MGETTKQIIISKVKLVKGGIRINYEKYRDSYWDTLQLTSEEKAAPEFYTEKYINGRRAQGNLFESDTK